MLVQTGQGRAQLRIGKRVGEMAHHRLGHFRQRSVVIDDGWHAVAHETYRLKRA